MGNVIQIKRGEGAPGNGVLAPNELGYDTTNKHLYIGTSSTPQLIGANCLPVANGGTGRGRMVANRLCWSSDSTTGGAVTEGETTYSSRINASDHYVDKDHICVNLHYLPDDAPEQGLYVYGGLRVDAGTTNGIDLKTAGNLTLRQTNSDYILSLSAAGALGLNSSYGITIKSDGQINIETGANQMLFLGQETKYFMINGGRCIAPTTNSGFFLTDHNGNSYAALYDNNANLWIGAERTATQHHSGQTYISSGHNGTTGNASIYVSVPNDDNNNASNYAVWHAGNCADPTNVKQSLSYSDGWRTLLYQSSFLDNWDDDPTDNTVHKAYYVSGIAVNPSTKQLVTSGSIRSQDSISTRTYVETGAIILHRANDGLTNTGTAANPNWVDSDGDNTNNFSWTGYGTSLPGTGLTSHTKGRLYFQYTATT